MRFFRPFLTSFIFAIPASAFSSTLDIIFATTLVPSATQQMFLDDTESFWETALVGYQSDIDIDHVTITIEAFEEDGEGGLLAKAGPTETVTTSGFTLPTAGAVDLDVSDLNRLEADGRLLNLLMHEVAHVLGFGTLWTENGVYVNGSGQYTGRDGLRAYQKEFDRRATSIPVELDGGITTQDSHWDETWAGGPNELMTGYLDPSPYFSDTTIASFRDLGYTTSLAPAPVPLPAGIMFGIGALGMLGAVRAGRKT